VKRRDLLKFGGLALAQAGVARFPMMAQSGMAMSGASPTPLPPADYTLRIAPVTVELAPDRILSTIGYNGTSPGPILRMKEGKQVTVDVINDTDTPELVHWHGMLIPSDVDGSEEEGSPFVPAHGRSRIQLTPGPAGSRWYHTHVMAMDDLHKGSYTGLFGFVYVDGGNDPGHYDQEHFLALRDWEPFFSGQMVDMDEMEDPTAPQPERPAVLNTAPNGLEVLSNTYSINDKALGVGEPIRVTEGQRVLFHFLNASAIENRRIALAGHKFQVIALDGNPVPNPTLVETLLLGAGERICAIVTMNNPGIWIMGAPEDDIRNAGLGVIVEYANQHKQPQWIKPVSLTYDLTLFGNKPGASATLAAHVEPIDMIFEKLPGGMGKFNIFLVNGKPYPHANEFVLQEGQRYRVTFRNRTDDAHPLHLHRHIWEIVDLNGKPTSGVLKDTVVVPFYGRATVEFTANQPGLSLFHCHIQQHMDYGFKALLRTA